MACWYVKHIKDLSSMSVLLRFLCQDSYRTTKSKVKESERVRSPAISPLTSGSQCRKADMMSLQIKKYLDRGLILMKFTWHFDFVWVFINFGWSNAQSITKYIYIYVDLLYSFLKQLGSCLSHQALMQNSRGIATPCWYCSQETIKRNSPMNFNRNAYRTGRMYMH